MNAAVSSDEKIMAALAHGSILFMFLGPIVPVILWATQRNRSKYVSFHALQAMGYQTLFFWLWMVMPIFIMLATIILIGVFAVVLRNSPDTSAFPFLFQIPIFIMVFGFMGITFLIGLVGAVFCLLGRDFRYPILGKWLARYLAYSVDSESLLDESQEDNWVAGICHATAVLQLWGVATPLIVWFSQKERSARLRFQSMQAFVYQLIALVVYVIGMAVYMAFFLGMMLTMTLGGTTGNNELQGPPAFVSMIFFVVMILFWLIIMVAMPIYYLLAGFAGFRVIRGHHFRYPILGKMIETRTGTLPRSESTT
jgi:uncharacterized Tic20 family protein